LPTEPFQTSYSVYEKAFGIESLTRPSRIGQGGQPECDPEVRIPLPPDASQQAGEGDT
jgi:hypothetical protein